MVAVNGIPEKDWVLEVFSQALRAARAETVKEVFTRLLEKCHVNAKIANKVAYMIV